MRILQKTKDGGPDSPVEAYFLCEFKNLFSIAFLKFNNGGRMQFQTHAFNAFTWLIWGNLIEENIDGRLHHYQQSIFPKYTPRSQHHRVMSIGTSWCFTIRGSWSKHWTEYDPCTKATTKFKSGRRVVSD